MFILCLTRGTICGILEVLLLLTIIIVLCLYIIANNCSLLLVNTNNCSKSWRLFYKLIENNYKF